jgi:DNA adenine methylase
MRLPPLLKWPGGKGRLATKLEQMIPPHRVYVEPFAGGSALFFRKSLAKVNVLGDKDPWPIQFFNRVRLGGLRKCRGGIKVSRGLFDRSLQGKHSRSACYQLARSVLSYHGDRATFGAAARRGNLESAQKLRRNLPKYEQKLRRANLRIGGFDGTMKAYDAPDAFHFLDPPWPLESGYSERHYHGGGKRKGSKKPKTKAPSDRRAFDPAYVRDVADKMKGAVLIIYGDHPSVRQAFGKMNGKNGWQVFTMKVATNKGIGGMEQRVNILAYKPARKR